MSPATPDQIAEPFVGFIPSLYPPFGPKRLGLGALRHLGEHLKSSGGRIRCMFL